LIVCFNQLTKIALRRTLESTQYTSEQFQLLMADSGVVSMGFFFWVDPNHGARRAAPRCRARSRAGNDLPMFALRYTRPGASAMRWRC
jgi:hypothetical protein